MKEMLSRGVDGLSGTPPYDPLVGMFPKPK
jgi:hypothetical protein